WLGGHPVQQLGAVARYDSDLRAVHVAVDEAGQDQATAVIVLGPCVVRRLFAPLRGDDAAAVDQQPVIGSMANRLRLDGAPFGRRREVEQIAAQGDSTRR